MTLNKRAALIWLVGITILIGANGANAWVKNISLERVFVGDTIRVHEVEVRCRIEKNTRPLRKVFSSNGPWCSVDVPDLCARAKISAARKLCKLNATEFKELVASVKQKPTSEELASVEVEQISEVDSIAQLKEEQLLIEGQRIEIEQRRIELTRQEVDLRKKLNEIDSAR